MMFLPSLSRQAGGAAKEGGVCLEGEGIGHARDVVYHMREAGFGRGRCGRVGV